MEEGGCLRRTAIRRRIVVEEVTRQHGARRLVKDVGEDFHVAHEGAAEAAADMAARLLRRAREGVFRLGERMEEVGAQDISGEAEQFGLLYESCRKGVGVRSVLGIFQKAQEFPDERIF